MTAAMVVVAIGILIMIADWHMATKPDEHDKTKRRKRLDPVKRRMIFDMIWWTAAVAAAVWGIQKFFD